MHQPSERSERAAVAVGEVPEPIWRRFMIGVILPEPEIAPALAELIKAGFQFYMADSRLSNSEQAFNSAPDPGYNIARDILNMSATTMVVCIVIVGIFAIFVKIY
ncbi:hypothetical protein MSG28_000260 [Choristoneura fumiferana]|uniref:Uncharacterized protein n=1 Tax=Choristoneura fumiferana TaxID=7141 RepID=A0ACC0K0C7_CHOFU|nr:hypothetical protein MSG28_000260 [Choristoneura fumiferana]